MVKPKAPTTQELMQQRQEREEQERTAYLPPGLINHGNTCFMNSVLQGLIATQLLSDLVHFAPIPPSVQERSSTLLAGQRSPQLTNGHNLSGPYEKPWVNTMPIGDVFLSIMYKSWDAQARRQRDIISPRALLGALGKKYDQYLDFAQQDAHEFLRILLDAMRMEELDIIKKRQPPPPPAPKTRRRTTIGPGKTSPNAPPIADAPPLPEIPEDQRLMSFADLIFGGKLTSILVCQKCKNVSQTYEDFNDISLSIKPEDYTHRKRDKLRIFAKRLTAFPSSGGSSNSTSSPPPLHKFPLSLPGIQRPSSVPPSPKERPDGQLLPRDEPPPTTNVRRRSLDVPPESAPPPDASDEPSEASSSSSLSAEKPVPQAEPTAQQPAASERESTDSHILVNLTGPEGKHVEFVEVTTKTDKKEKRKSQVEENWAKLGRRLSLGLGGGKSKDRKARSEERSVGKTISPPIVEGVQLQPPTEDAKRNTRLSTDSITPRPSLGSIVQAVSGRTPSPDVRSKPPPAPDAAGRQSSDATITATLSTASSSSLQPNPALPTITHSRSKSPKPPRATPAEAEYLRKILADVVPASSGSNPLSTLFRPQGHHHLHLSPHGHGGKLGDVWLGINQLSGIEECLRMFTAVEVLDGENMVGCRRCWKIANGQMPGAKSKGGALDEDDSEGSAGQNDVGDGVNVGDVPPPSAQVAAASSVEGQQPLSRSASGRSKGHSPHGIRITPPSGSVHIPTSISTPTVSYYAEKDGSVDALNPLYKNDNRSISSLPTAHTAASSESQLGDSTGSGTDSAEEGGDRFELAVEEPLGSAATTPGGLPIPVIETTEAPDTPVPPPVGAGRPPNGIVAPQPTRPIGPAAVRLAGAGADANGVPRASVDSLPVPSKTTRVGRRHAADGGATTTEDEAEEDEGSSAYESDTSYGTSVSGDSIAGAGGEHGNPKWRSPPGLETSVSSSSQVTPTSLASSSAVGQPVTQAAGAAVAPVPVPQQKKPPSKPKPVIMRPAYKRYLIDTPPPVLVIHLKRFQQLAKTQFLSFSHGFKKLDDYVTFPEYLDLTPYLAPKKEDYGLGKKKGSKGKGRDKEGGGKEKGGKERCMYRLYAVVVHIGNMLGGHYIAYTALPSKSPIEGEGLATKKLMSPPQSPQHSQSQAQPQSQVAPPPAPPPSVSAAKSQDSTSAKPKPKPEGVSPTPMSRPSTSSSSSKSESATNSHPSSTAGVPLTREKSSSQQQQQKPRQWAYISDTIVRLTTLEEVLNAKAYICMYERC